MDLPPDFRVAEEYEMQLLRDRVLDDVLEEMSILWTDDLPYIVIMVLRTLSNLRVSHTELKVPAKFKSSEDPEFVKTLFEKSLVNYSAFQAYIELDEWIEISKYYSTPGSSTFINGVLDKIVESLTAEGRIKKAGRGLI